MLRGGANDISINSRLIINVTGIIGLDLPLVESIGRVIGSSLCGFGTIKR